MRCLGCNYSLENLTVHRCPECGRAFDPNKIDTYMTNETITTRTVLMPIALLVGLAVVGHALLLWTRWGSSPPWYKPLFILGSATYMGTIALACVILWRQRRT